MSDFESVNDDILQNILFKLPALSFTSAAYVSRSWNEVCDKNLCCPKFISALSLNPSLSGAVKEVLDKVLSEPIRPQFAIASIGSQFSFEEVHKQLTEKLSSKIPIIITAADGILGKDAITGTMREVRWYWFIEKDGPVPREADEFNRGIVLMIGYLPGLKVDAIPLLRPKDHQVAMVDKFIEDIETYTTKISGHAKPTGIIVFGDQHADLHPVIAEIDHVMPKETVVVGDASIRRFMFKSGHDCQKYNLDAVALVLARDRNKPDGIGEIRLDPKMDVRLVPFGPELRVISVTAYKGTNSSLTFSTNGAPLDWERFWDDISDEIHRGFDIYIGVIQERPSSSEQKKMELRSYSAFYEVIRGGGQEMVVKGAGMEPGDRFLFYRWVPPPIDDESELPQDTAGGGGDDGVFGILYLEANRRVDKEIYYDNSLECSGAASKFAAGFIANRVIGRHEPIVPVTHKADEESSGRRGIRACTNVWLEISYDPPSPNL